MAYAMAVGPSTGQMVLSTKASGKRGKLMDTANCTMLMETFMKATG